MDATSDECGGKVSASSWVDGMRCRTEGAVSSSRDVDLVSGAPSVVASAWRGEAAKFDSATCGVEAFSFRPSALLVDPRLVGLVLEGRDVGLHSVVSEGGVSSLVASSSAVCPGRVDFVLGDGDLSLLTDFLGDRGMVGQETGTVDGRFELNSPQWGHMYSEDQIMSASHRGRSVRMFLALQGTYEFRPSLPSTRGHCGDNMYGR